MAKSFVSHSYILIIALFIDGLVAGLSFGLAGLVTASSAGIAAIPVVGPVLGTAVGTAAIPVGILLGFVTAFSINAALGAGFVMFLSLKGMFYPEIAFVGMLGEFLPGINNLPLWTATAWRSIRKKVSEDEKKKIRASNIETGEEVEEYSASIAPPQERGGEGSRRPPRDKLPEAANDNGEDERETRSRPLLKNPRMNDGVVPKPASLPKNDNRPKQAYAA